MNKTIIIGCNVCVKMAMMVVTAMLALNVNAQIGSLFNDSYSPTQSETRRFEIRPETRMQDMLLDNPALINGTVESRRAYFIDNPLADSLHLRSLFIAADGSLGRHNGDYLAVNGNDFRDLTFRANGYTKIKNSTLFGNVSFTMGQHRNVGWNTQRNANLYWPYIMADSTGGNFHYETYNIMCAYSFNLNGSVAMGVSGEYKGDFAFKQTDPRVENISSWFTLKTGAAYRWNKNNLALAVEYMLHRQHMDVKHFRSGQFTRFYVEYGFGMFDNVHSPVFNSTKYQHHIHNFGASLSFMSDPDKPLRMNAVAKYNLDNMTTEDYTYKLNLYRALTNQIDLGYGLLWNSNRWGVSLTANADIDLRAGREFIQERYVSASVDGVDVYDYRKIGHQDRYSLDTFDGKIDAKMSYFASPNLTFSLLAGMNYFTREEKYKDKNYLIKNALATPMAGIETCYRKKSTDLNVKAVYGRRFSVENKYRVGVDLERQTEFPHAFATYAYYGYDANVLNIELKVSHDYSFARLGFNATIFMVDGKRLKDIAYDADRFASSSPLPNRHAISLTPDEHKAWWAQVAVFAEF